jgi:hypothetical protein
MQRKGQQQTEIEVAHGCASLSPGRPLTHRKLYHINANVSSTKKAQTEQR